MSTPCKNDTRFISDDPTIMAEAALLCARCPVQAECFELRVGDAWGVAGGTLPDHPVRLAHRAQLDRRVTCPAGHPKKEYTIDLERCEEGMAHPLMACSMCSALLAGLIDKASEVAAA